MEMAKLQEVDVTGRPMAMAAAPPGDFLAQLESMLDNRLTGLTKKMNAQSAGMHKEMKAQSAGMRNDIWDDHWKAS